MRLSFAGTQSPVLALFMAAAALALATLLYRRVLELRRGAVLLALRLAATLALVLFFVRPILSFERGGLENASIAVLLDASRSMGVRDAMGGVERLEAAKALLSELSPRLAEIAPLEVTAFDRAPWRIDAAGLAALRAQGDGTELGAALRAAGRAGGPRPVAVVLLTDGRDTGATPLGDAAGAAGAPIFPVAIGAREGVGALRDAAIAGLTVAHEALVGTSVPVRVSIATTGYETTPGTLELCAEGRVLARAEVALAPGRTEASLAFTPAAPGLAEYEVRLAPLPGERLLENNARTFPLAVSPERLRVLAYEGAPRWEYKYVRRALAKDAGIGLAALVRTSADRVYGQGAAELAAFPAAGGLERFGAILLGDVGRQELAPAQAEALRAYVEAGGGLVVAGGRTLFGPDGLRNSPLEAALPLALAGAAREVPGPLAMRATREGEAHPALAGVPPLLPVEAAFAAGAPKAGAEVLATAGDLPVVLAQRYGRGRVLLVATDSTWGWCAGAAGEALHARFWGQVLRWAASREGRDDDRGGAARLTTDKEIYAAGEPVRIALAGVEAARAVVDGPAGAEDVPLSRGGALFRPRAGGLHVARAAGLERRFLVERDARELAEPTVNEPLLERIAAETGGAAFTQASAADLPAAVARAADARRARVEWAADRSPWLFLVFVLLLGADWMVRRWLGLI
jgi:uncharacterized membrane protein